MLCMASCTWSFYDVRSDLCLKAFLSQLLAYVSPGRVHSVAQPAQQKPLKMKPCITSHRKCIQWPRLAKFIFTSSNIGVWNTKQSSSCFSIPCSVSAVKWADCWLLLSTHCSETLRRVTIPCSGKFMTIVHTIRCSCLDVWTWLQRDEACRKIPLQLYCERGRTMLCRWDLVWLALWSF